MKKKRIVRKTYRSQTGRKYKAFKKTKKPQHKSIKRKDTDTGTAEKASTDSKKLKLKIADSLVEGLTTHMSISAHDARTIVKN